MPTATRSVKLAEVFGIRIGANPSWFLALLLMIVLLGDRFEVALPDLSPAGAYGLAVVAAVLFFVSLIAHELGHALAGRRFGIRTEGIDLWLLGGVARLSRDSRTPKEEFVVAFAGPAVTLLICALGVGAGLLLGTADELEDAIRVSGTETTAALSLVGWLTLVNGVLFVFNMVPAFPLDGGRIARSIAWKLTGDRRRATVVAGFLGRGFAVLLGAYGVYLLMEGDSFGGIWYLLLAWFVAGAARAAVVTSEISEQLHEVAAGDIMDAGPPWLPADVTVLDAEHETFAPFRVAWAAMLDPDGRYLGIVTRDRVRDELAAGRPGVEARELLERERPQVDPTLALEDLLASDDLRRLGAVPVVDADGVMRGLVTFAQVRDALARALPGADVRA
ncbi:site-2 protease family protein [Patulibacter sp. SYSU D01012]|uniref:site-2 protease family protein n=1 Tax=Patulibacter sp. SYSU D01012 TaxID=2817381 RepID=UPI001B30678F|nr:site-2 protease family protein [Patulibacter sp. SYSU D01012]